MPTSEYFLIAEDHGLTNMGYTLFMDLHFRDSNYKIVNTMKDLREILDQQGHRFTFAIWDLELTDDDMTNKIDFIEETVQKFPSMYILIVTTKNKLRHVNQLYAAGIRGFLVKDSKETEILNAIQTVLSGQIFESKLVKQYRAMNGSDTKSNSPAEPNPFLSLSRREQQVLRQILEGQRLKDISSDIGVKQSTIATYKHRLLEKVNARNIIELHEMARLHNFV